MSSCIADLTKPIAYDCNNKPIAGLETTAVWINRKDIDFAAVVKNASGTKVTSLPLLTGKTGIKIDWIKKLSNSGSEFVKKDDAANGHKHSFAGRIFNLDENGLETINALADGVEGVIIVETKWKGTDQKSAFQIFGLDSGMVLSEGKYNSGENNGSYLFTVATEDGYEESKAFYLWLETATIAPENYADTKARFDALLA